MSVFSFDLKQWIHTYERHILDVPEGAFALGSITNLINREVTHVEAKVVTTFIKILDELRQLHDKKSHDYAAASNRYSNFEEAAQFAGCSVDTVFRVLIGIKWSRLRNLLADGKVPNNESIDDTILDVANYTIIWESYRRDHNQEQVKHPEECKE